jgi:hypothetical protein
MERNILIEVNRVREIMGLTLLIKEQAETNPPVIRTIDGVEYKVTTSTLPPYESGKWSATFPPGKWEGADIEGNIDGDIQTLVDWLDNPDLVNASIVVSINAGSSKTPIGVGGELDRKLNSLGKPGNKGLAELRAATAAQLVKSRLQGIVPTEIFKNITWVTDITQVEKGPEFVSGTDDPNDAKYRPYQFLSATAIVTGQEETLEKIPKWCENAKVGKKGGGVGKKENGFRAIKNNEYKGAEYDMGEGEAIINLLFNSFTVPDMFQVTYNNNVYTSEGPDGRIGFVSGEFQGLTNAEEIRWQKKLDALKDKIIKSESKNRDRGLKQYSHIFKHNGVPLRDDTWVDVLWLNEFFKKFPPLQVVQGKGIPKPGKEKYNPAFISHPLEDSSPSYKNNEKVMKQYWNRVREASKKLRPKTGKLVSKYEEMEKTILKLREGDPTFYAFWRSRELRGLAKGKSGAKIPEVAIEGFRNGVIGDQGTISFKKVPGVNKFYVQVYAPFGGTAWRADVRCDKIKGTQSFSTKDRGWLDDVQMQVRINK